MSINAISTILLICLGSDPPILGREPPVSGSWSAERTLKSLETLEKSDLEHINRRGVGRANSDGFERDKSLVWSVRLLQKEVLAGDPVFVEVSVNNTSDKYSFRFSPPARGFFVANLQIWIRKTGVEKYRTLDHWNDVTFKDSLTGVPVLLGPNEKRVWVSQANQFAGVDGLSALRPNYRLKIDDFMWCGTESLLHPGKYEIAVRYLNMDPLQTWELDYRSLKKTDTEKGFKEDSSQPRVFGPFPMNITERRDAKNNWTAIALEHWEYARPSGSDVRTGSGPGHIEILEALTEKQLGDAGRMGDSVRLWKFARNWSKLSRGKEDTADAYDQALTEFAARFPANDPHRSAAEFLRTASRLERGDAKGVIADSLSSTNPDIQLLVGRWLLEERAKKGK